jgi:hypothetical protein
MEAELCIQDIPATASLAPAEAWSDVVMRWADAQRRWLLAAVVCIYLVGINGQWRMEPDSALYLSLARNIAAGRGYTYHDKPNAAAYPGLPYALSVVFRLFPGEHANPQNLVVENILMPLVGLATLGLTYRLLRLSVGRPTAVVVTCGVGLTRTFYRAAFALMTDMPFLLGVMAFLAGYEGFMRPPPYRRGERWLDAALMIFGGAITIVMRPAWLAFVPVAVAALAIAGLRKRIPWKTAVSAVAIAALAAAIFYAGDPRRMPGKENGGRYEDAVFTQMRADQRRQFGATMEANALDILRQTATSAMLGIKFGPAPDVLAQRHWYDRLGAAANIAGAIATLGLGLALWRKRSLWGMWVAATVLMMIAVLPNERYFLQVLPLLILAWWQGLQWLNHRLPAAAGNIVFAVLLTLGFAPNFAHVIGVVIEQRQIPFMDHYHDGKWRPLVAAADRISQLAPQAVVLAPDKTARILSYLSRRTVVEQNDYQIEVGWPPRGGYVFALVNPNDASFTQWLTNLGITQTRLVPHGAEAGMGNLQLHRVPRDELNVHQ